MDKFHTCKSKDNTKWDGQRPPINYVLMEFRRHLIQKKMDLLSNKKRTNTTLAPIKDNGIYDIEWIEKLLHTSIADNRKFCLWRISIPYLKNIKKMNGEEITPILLKWLDGCDRCRKLDFNPCQKIKENINYMPDISLNENLCIVLPHFLLIYVI